MRSRTVIVAHRETMVAEGIAAALERHPLIASALVATHPAELERWEDLADAAALDARFPTAAAARLRARGVRVVVLGGESGGEDDGIRVPTRASVADLVRALIPESASIRTREPHHLTRREREVLQLVARGLVAKQVARQLGISPKTVEVHKTRIYAKLGVPNQAAAVHRMLAAGVVGVHPWIPSST